MDRSTREGGPWDRLVALVRSGALVDAPSTADLEWLEKVTLEHRLAVMGDQRAVKNLQESLLLTEHLHHLGIFQGRGWYGANACPRPSRPLLGRVQKSGPGHLLRLSTTPSGVIGLKKLCGRQINLGWVQPERVYLRPTRDLPWDLCKKCREVVNRYRRKLASAPAIYIEDPQND